MKVAKLALSAKNRRGIGLLIPEIPVSKHYITDNELQAIKSLIYYFDDLFKPQIQWASKEAYRQGRPDASRFYDVWHEPMWFISRMKQLISRNS